MMIRAFTVCALATLAVPHPHAPNTDFVKQPLGNETIITGSGNFTYQYDPTKLVLPPSVALLNAHGLAISQVDGAIYFTYESQCSNKMDCPDGTAALIRFNPDGTNATLLGDKTLAYGTPHGLKLSTENGVEYLYHANNYAIVHKTTLDGTVVWSSNMSALWPEGNENYPFKPTDVLVPPGSPIAYVADGYSQSKVHGFDINTGNYTGFVFGGKGKQDKPILFNCDHGISFDTRVNQIVVSDRANGRLRWIDTQGNLLATKEYEDLPYPCNAQTSFGTDLGGDYMIVPDLGTVTPKDGVVGIVGILDKANQLVSKLEIQKYLGKTGSMYPHDAIFLRNGDIAIVCWKPGTITYWKKIPAVEQTEQL